VIERGLMNRNCIYLLCLSSLVTPTAHAEVDSSLLSVERIFHDNEFEINSKAASKWLRGGESYTTIEQSESVADGFDIVRHDPSSGEQSILVAASQLIPDGDDKPIEIKDYSWSEDGRFALIATNTVRFRRYEPLADYWLLNLANAELRQVGTGKKASSLMYAKFSPDSSSVAYLYLNNIYLESIDGKHTKQLTHDGSDLIVNGTGDWVNEEELSLRDGFKWSPDSKSLCYWWFDTEGVGTFYMIKNTDDVYSKPIPLQYPKAGTTNSAVRVGVVDVATAETTWMQLEDDPRQNYVPEMDWADSSEQVIIQYVNRLQNKNRVYLGNGGDGSVEHIFTDEDEAWIDPNRDLKWLVGGKHFTWLSERDGWRHLYTVSRNGKNIRLVTPGEFDILKVDHIDTENGWVYYTASPDDNAARYLFRSPLSGAARVERLTPPSESGFHVYDIAPNSRWAFHTFSTMTSPPRVDVVRLPDHESQRVVVENNDVEELLAKTPRGRTEFFTVDIGDGVQLDAWMMTPPDFDPDKQYPLLMYVYGEPAGQTVIQTWDTDLQLWHTLLAQQGYIIASVDPRGTPAPNGRAWRKSIYGRIGIQASADEAKAVQALLADRPYLDPERVGSWGWSGGGQMTLNAMFRYPEIYRTGIAISFVSDQRLYDTIYQERYMGLPQENVEGYTQGSPITHVAGLAGNLLLIHGTADDNVHYQSTEQLVDRLIELNKTFSLMIYPDRSHSINEKTNTKRHLYNLMTNFLNEHLSLQATSGGSAK